MLWSKDSSTQNENNRHSERLTVAVVKLNENWQYNQMSVYENYQVKVSPKWEWVVPLNLRTSATTAPERLLVIYCKISNSCSRGF